MAYYGLPLDCIYKDFYIEDDAIHFVTRGSKPKSRPDVP